MGIPWIEIFPYPLTYVNTGQSEQIYVPAWPLQSYYTAHNSFNSKPLMCEIKQVSNWSERHPYDI